MKHKSAELLVPPSPCELISPQAGFAAAAASTSTGSASAQSSLKKPPHVLPPLADKRKSAVNWRPAGSPPPAWRRPSVELEGVVFEGTENRPRVKISRYPDPQTANSVRENAASSASAGLSKVKYAPLEPIKRRGTQQ